MFGDKWFKYCKMSIFVFWCVFFISLIDCRGSPIAGPQVKQAFPKNEFLPQGVPAVHSDTIQQLYGLLDESNLKETLSQVPLLPDPQNKNNPEMPPNVLSVQTSTERLYTSKPNFGFSGEDNVEPEESRIKPQKLDLSLPVEKSQVSQDGVQELLGNGPITKSPLEYQSGVQLPSDLPLQTITINDRVKETTTTAQEVPSEKPTTKSPLEYQSQKPSYASAPGGISGGHLGQLIPFGDPLPAGPLVQTITIIDRLKETTTTAQVVPSEKPTTKSPLEYQSQRPSYASAPGGISGGHLGQLIPAGNLLPAGPSVQIITINDRLKETTTTPQEVLNEKPTTKSPLEYQSQKPSFASAPGGISGGHLLGQLIPSGDPLPSGASVENIIIQDRVKETTSTTIEQRPSLKPSTKLPWIGFPGIIEGIFVGQFGQLIPPGKPLPASSEKPMPDIEDRFQVTSTTTSSTTIRQNPTTKSPLEYQNQKPSYAGAMSGGNWGPLIPPGKPWPADPVTQRPTLVDRFKETTTTTSQQLSTQKSTPKSPLEYQTQRPSFAGIPGGISGGHLDTLVPPGKPWPADTQTQRPVLEDRFKETTSVTIIQERPSQKPSIQSPLDYEHQRPSFVGEISGGHFGQLIPPGKPWPANAKPQNPLLEDRFKETTTTSVRPLQSLQTTNKRSAEYIPQKPSYAGQLSSGNLGQLIPPGRPWPAWPASK